MFNDSLKKYNLHLSKKICQPMISMFGLKTMCEYLSKESFIIKMKKLYKIITRTIYVLEFTHLFLFFEVISMGRSLNNLANSGVKHF